MSSRSSSNDARFLKVTIGIILMVHGIFWKPLTVFVLELVSPLIDAQWDSTQTGIAAILAVAVLILIWIVQASIVFMSGTWFIWLFVGLYLFITGLFASTPTGVDELSSKGNDAHE